jgi:hypothetical protein
VVLLVRASHDELVAALRRADTDGLVGPTAASGWTCVWLDGDDLEGIDGLGFSTYLWAHPTRSGLTVELVRPGGAPERRGWALPSDPVEMTTLAGALVDLFGPAGAVGALRSMLVQDDLDIESFWDRVDGVLDLPELLAREPERCLVATRGDPARIRMAAMIAGPTWIMPVNSGWTLAIPTHEEESQADVLAAAISGAAKRRERTIHIWSHGQAVGLQIWRRGSLDVSWSWGTAWETIVGEPLEFESEVCDAIAALNPDLHLPSPRALLRQDRLDEAAVTSLFELLGLPDSIRQTLTASRAPEGIPGAELIQKATPRQATLAAMRSDWADRRQIRNRPLYVAYAIGSAVAAVVCWAMTCLGVAVLVTDGAVVDQPGDTAEDWLFVGVSAVLTIVLVPTAIYRLRRARKRERAQQQRPM